MSETTDRAALVSAIASANSALPAAQSALTTAIANLEASQQAWEVARKTYGIGSTQERTAFADVEAKQQLQRIANAEVISRTAIVNESIKDLIALPSGRVWQAAEAKASGIVQGKQHMAEALGVRYSNAATAMQTLRGLITASITPDQLTAQSASALATVTNNLVVQNVGQIDLRQGSPTARPTIYISPIQHTQHLSGND